MIKVVHISFIVTLFLFIVPPFLIPHSINEPSYSIGIYDMFEIHDNIVVASVEGSGSFVCISIYDQSHKLRVMKNYKSIYGDGFYDLQKIDKVIDNTESIGDGTYIIGNLDFDDNVEIVLYSILTPKVGKIMYQITPKGDVLQERSVMIYSFTYILSFTRSLFFIFILLLLFVIEIGILMKYIYRKFVERYYIFHN